MKQSSPALSDEQLMAELGAMMVRNNLEDLHAGNGPISDALMKQINRRVRDAFYTCLHAVRWQERSFSASKWIDYHAHSIPSYWEAPELIPGYRDGLEPETEGSTPAPIDRTSLEFQAALDVVRQMLDRIAGKPEGRFLRGPGSTIRRQRLERLAIDRYLKIPTAERQDSSRVGYLEFDLTERVRAMRGTDAGDA